MDYIVARIDCIQRSGKASVVVAVRMDCLHRIVDVFVEDEQAFASASNYVNVKEFVDVETAFSKLKQPLILPAVTRVVDRAVSELLRGCC